MVHIPKLKAILLYFCTYTDERFLGKVKLMKLLYFLDFTHIKRYGSPVTYDNYVNLEHGPIPSAIKNLVDTAADDHDSSILSDTIFFERPEGIEMFRVKPRRELTQKDKNYFSESELEILNRVCLRFGDKNTKFIEEESHKEAPWKETKLLDPIPYTLAAKDNDCMVSEDEIKTLMKI